ncbi:MAG: hypothetical protein HQL21_00680 [Candidatus Omnitrophica bacterium]|nr:hypothetical protein [Candidatus Omnitrophota bacterium]
MDQTRTPLPWKSKIILSAIALAILVGLFLAYHDLTILSAKRRNQPFVFAGKPFEMIKFLFKGERVIGYISDRNIDDKNIGAQFAQTQLGMAPIILDLNNLNHRFLILDCQDERNATNIMMKFNIRPIKRSNTGIIIAERDMP